MASIGGIGRVVSKLNKGIERYFEGTVTGPSVIVGYTGNYAIYVHENLEMKWQGLPRKKPGKGFYWDPQGKAKSKFLEDPARRLERELGDIVRGAVKNGLTLVKGLLMAGLRLQRESMLEVPVDTGNLKASAFTRQEK